MKILASYLILFFSCIGIVAQAQQTDSIQVALKQDSIKNKRAVNKAIYSSARKATIMSACFPGLGQIYNKKYWKAPVIYAALGGLGYWGITNQKKYKFYSDNLRAANDDDANTVNSTLYTSDQLVTQKKYYQKYRDMSIMLGALVYLVNIIDANVDAHLKTFDVSDDLSLQIDPYSGFGYNNKLQAGLSLKLKFK
ncbi:MAG: hypothetical protein HY062_00690 [Bacteroidetes bacterium]|nr:hypothetical protein [Bacteroidota bacterium]